MRVVYAPARLQVKGLLPFGPRSISAHLVADASCVPPCGLITGADSSPGLLEQPVMGESGSFTYFHEPVGLLQGTTSLDTTSVDTTSFVHCL